MGDNTCTCLLMKRQGYDEHAMYNTGSEGGNQEETDSRVA